MELKDRAQTTQSTTSDFDEIQISPKVIERIKRGALLYPDQETGEALVGVTLPAKRKNGFPLMVILETISAGFNAERRWAMFSQGDDWQGDIFNWLNENWEVYREMRRRSYGKSASEQWDLPLMHLGDWHKQPGMTMPSSADYRTAKEFLKDNNRDYLLTPIVTFAEEADAPVFGNTLIFEDIQPAVRIDFWGIGKKDRDFIPLKPVTSLGYGLPRLPEVVWWLDDSQRLDLEIAALEKDGLQVMDIVQHNADKMPPLETCFVIYRPGTTQILLAVTPYTYPKKSPEWRIAPLLRPEDDKDWFEILFDASQPVAKEALQDWSGHTHALIDGVRMIEAHMKKDAS